MIKITDDMIKNAADIISVSFRDVAFRITNPDSALLFPSAYDTAKAALEAALKVEGVL